jgi:hypothetical protein
MARKRAKPTDVSAKSGNTDDTSVIEWWWRFQPQIADEPLALDGIRKRCNSLETIVEPHVTRQKTEDAILFKGKLRYLDAKSHEPGSENRLVWSAALALQCLYNLENAISAGDVNAMIQWTHGFSRCDFDVMVSQRCEWDVWGAVAHWELAKSIDRARRQAQAEGPKKRRGQNKLQAHNELLRSLHTQYCCKHNFMKLIREALAERGINVSDDTLRTRLKQLRIYRK